MKRKIALFVVLVGAALVLTLALGSCMNGLGGVSVIERLDAFLADLNSNDRSNIYLNFHSSETTDYTAIRNGTKPDWDALFPLADRPYSYQNLNTSNTDAVTANVVGTAFNKPVVFKMQTEGLDWQIEELTVFGSLEIQ